MSKTAEEIEAAILEECAQRELVAHLRRQLAPRIAAAEVRSREATERRKAFRVAKP